MMIASSSVGLEASLEFPLERSRKRGLEFDSRLRLHYICHVSSHVDATWAHVADTWIHVACHVATVDPSLTGGQPPLTGGLAVVDRWSGGGPSMVNGGPPPLIVVDRHR
ncbi:hypothetical protein Tco_0181315 [Tanacetum coccineum]